jgi:hypothetical protein
MKLDCRPLARKSLLWLASLWMEDRRTGMVLILRLRFIRPSAAINIRGAQKTILQPRLIRARARPQLECLETASYQSTRPGIYPIIGLPSCFIARSRGGQRSWFCDSFERDRTQRNTGTVPRLVAMLSRSDVSPLVGIFRSQVKPKANSTWRFVNENLRNQNDNFVALYLRFWFSRIDFQCDRQLIQAAA